MKRHHHIHVNEHSYLGAGQNLGIRGWTTECHERQPKRKFFDIYTHHKLYFSASHWEVFTRPGLGNDERAKNAKTYNNRDSQLVTRISTDRSIDSLNRADLTGYLAFYHLWSYVLNINLL